MLAPELGQALREGLRARGYVEGQTIVVECTGCGGPLRTSRGARRPSWCGSRSTCWSRTGCRPRGRRSGRTKTIPSSWEPSGTRIGVGHEQLGPARRGDVSRPDAVDRGDEIPSGSSSSRPRCQEARESACSQIQTTRAVARADTRTEVAARSLA